MNDQRFFDLAMKVIAHQCNDAERAELDALLAREPELRAEFTRLEADVRLAKEVLPLVAACTSSTGQFPAYARERLQTTVRQTLGRPESAAQEPGRSLAWGWRWVLGLASGDGAGRVHRGVVDLPRAERASDSTSDARLRRCGLAARTSMNWRLFKERGRKVQSNAFPAQANWKRGRKTGPRPMDGLPLKSFTMLQQARSEYPGVPEGSFSKELFF